MADRRSPWPNFFYDVCEWFYWAPENFGRMPNPDVAGKGWDHVRRRLGRNEEPLNLILRIMFALGPDSLIAKLTDFTIGEVWSDKYHVVGRDFEQRYGLPVNSTQPDFVFDGTKHLVTMEMKVRDKTYPTQLAKYLYLHAKAEECGKARQHALIYLGPTTWPELWRDRRNASFSERLAEAIDQAPKTMGMARVPIDAARLSEMASQIRLGYLSYGELAEIFGALRDEVSADGWEREVAARLLDGAIHEITTRGLAENEGIK